MRVAFPLAVSAAALLTISTAHAGPTTASELLNSYNLIVLGDLTNKSHVDGKTYVGGNATGGDYNQHNVGINLPALTVGGNVSGSVNINGSGGAAIGGNFAADPFNGNNSGPYYIRGSWTGQGNFNGNVYLGGTKTGSGNVNGGGTLSQNQTSPAFLSHIPTSATTTAIQNTLTTYSGWLDGLSANSQVQFVGGKAVFDATTNVNGIAVFDINNAIAFFNSINEIDFKMGNATQLIINVSGASSSLLNIAENFLGGSAQSRALDTIWNFTDAKNIKIDAQFGGTILALLADVNLNGNEEGTLVAKSATVNKEVHYVGPNNNIPSPPPEGPPVSQTPLPGALPLFATGLGALVLIARRRKQKTVA